MPRVRTLLCPLVACLFLAAPALPSAAQPPAAEAADEGLTRLLHQPDIQGDTIVFVYAGDLWVVGADGGTARRLTSDPGQELFPKLSPDGRWVAFTGQYSGSRQVFVIPVAGGTPRQLTFYNDVGDLPPRGGVDNRVLDWTPDGKSVLFGAHRLPWGERMEIPYTVPMAGGMEAPIGIPEGSGATFAPDGHRVAYTPISREFRTWKRYHGGRAQDVWIFDLATTEAQQITDYDGTDNLPSWVGDTIYFTSDRAGGTLNLFAYDTTSGTTRQVTHHDDWDVLWPSGGTAQVVYEAGGWIWRYDPAAGTDTKVPIRVYGDFAGQVPHFVDVADDIEDGTISPTGARALFAARGDLFTVPAEHGTVRPLTRSSGVRERDPAWSPDGRQVAYWSDRSGEYELYVRAADGSGDERRVTTDGAAERTWRYAPVWSPDSQRIAYGDRRAHLRVVDVASGRTTDVDHDPFADITDVRWSPDSRWLAYTKVGDSQLSSVWVYSIADGTAARLTSDDTNEAEPVWDPKGRYLYFLSDRDFNLTVSGFEFDFLYTNPTRVYVGLLSADAPALFLPKSDEEKVGEEAAGEKAGAEGTGEKAGAAKGRKGKGGKAAPAGADEDGKAAVKVVVEPEGFESRVRALPGEPDNYRSLAATDTGVLFLGGDPGHTRLTFYDLDAEEAKTVLEGVVGYELSADGKKILYVAPGGGGRTWGIVPVEPGKKPGDGKLALSGMETKVDPTAEWRQEFVDAWRILRDWFYDPGMHGLDWEAMRAKYEPLVPYIAARPDLDFLLGELGGELSSGHVYVQTSDDWQVEHNDGGLLGAVIEPADGVFRVAKIFPGENWHEDFRSPLTEPGVHVAVGDYLLAVDGVPTRGVDNFYRLLENKADQVVTLTVATDPGGAGSHEERVRPVTSETNLRYLDWVESRRRTVDEASGGRIGYIHLPNTAVEGSRALFKGFYAQSRKDALILDDRYNGGGFIPFRIIEMLDRPLLSYWARRNLEPFTTPGFFNRGPKVALINGYASSGGDAFPYYFREQGLGKLIGTRTWGGLIGLSGNPSLADGGTVLVPTFRFVTPGGEWAVEGVGVEPDVRVVDRPDLVAKGHDPTLEAAIQELLTELEAHPPAPLTVPEPPEKQRR